MFLKNFLNHKTLQLEKLEKFQKIKKFNIQPFQKFSNSNFSLLENHKLKSKIKNPQKKNFCEKIQQQQNPLNPLEKNSNIDPYFKELFQNYSKNDAYWEIAEGNFDVFLDKIKHLKSKEESRRMKNKEFASEIRQITINSKEPMRNVLIHYEIYRNQNGFDPEAIAETILVLGKLNASRDRFFRVYADLTHWEFLNSVRLYNLSEDIKACLMNEFSYVSGSQLIRIIKGMKLAHYKNTEIMDLICQKIYNYVNNNQEIIDFSGTRFSEISGSGKKNFGYQNILSTIFQEDESFKIYLEKLMKFEYIEESEETEDLNNLNNLEQNNIKEKNIKNSKESLELANLEKSLNLMISNVHEAKNLQKNFVDNIYNILKQFIQMEQVLLENKNIKDDPYIRHKLNRIQDKFIQMGFLDSENIKKFSTEKLEEKEIENLLENKISSIMQNYIYANYPDLFSNIFDQIEKENISSEKISNQKKIQFKRFNISPLEISECLLEISEYSKMPDIDINAQDYENQQFNLDFHNKPKPEKNVEFIPTIPEYTKLYNLIKILFENLELKNIKLSDHYGNENNINNINKINKFNSYANLIQAYSNMKMDFNNDINNKYFTNGIQYLKACYDNESLPLQNEEIVKGLFAIANSGLDNIQRTLNSGISRLDVFEERARDLDMEMTVKALWSIFSAKFEIDEKIASLILHLSDFDILNNLTENVDFYTDVNLYYETTIAIKQYLKSVYEIEKKEELMEISQEIFLITNKYFDNISEILKRKELNGFDPLKKNMKKFFVENFLKKKFDYSDNNNNNITLIENNVEFQKLQIPFKPDFILNIFGNKIALFLNSIDYDLNFTNGRQNLQKIILEENFGHTCVFIPISKILKFNFETFKMEINNLSELNNLEDIIIKNIMRHKKFLAKEISEILQQNKIFRIFVKNSVEYFGEDVNNNDNKNQEKMESLFKNLLMALELQRKINYNSTFIEFENNLTELKKLFAVMEINFSLMDENFKNNFNILLNKTLKENNINNNNNNNTDNTDITFKEFLVSFISSHQNYFKKIKNSLEIPYQKENEKILLTNPSWIGKRLNIDLLDDNNNKTISSKSLEKDKDLVENDKENSEFLSEEDDYKTQEELENMETEELNNNIKEFENLEKAEDKKGGLIEIEKKIKKNNSIKENYSKEMSKEFLLNKMNLPLKDILINLQKKNCAIELLNNNYMWFDKYNPYYDWELELKEFFDNFNYFPENSNVEYFYNSHPLGNRKVSKGVIPNPNKIRIMRENSLSLGENIIKTNNSYENELNSFIHLNEILVKEEILKNQNSKAKKIPKDLSMKINLLNINNSLKQNFEDNEIIKFLSNFEFTEKLIEEHLKSSNLSNNSKDNLTHEKIYVNRNSNNFKNFNEQLDNLREQFDGFDKFVMKEVYQENELFSYDKNSSRQEILKILEQKMKKKYEENIDEDALSLTNPNEISYKFNLESILRTYSGQKKDSYFSFNIYNDSQNNSNNKTSENFLEFKRKISERNFIILSIVSKILQEKNLSQTEKNYIAFLSKKINSSNILEIENSTMPDFSTNLKLENLTENDLYALNSLGNVEISDELKDYSISDLLLEFNNFIDNETINKLIYQIFSEFKAKEFSISENSDINLFDNSNKEPFYLNQEIKENIWRVSGFFDNLDAEKLRNFLKVKRGKSSFDKLWLEIDENSLNEFLKEVNCYENRLEYLEKWIKRKETEFQNRINLPPENLKISDTQINKAIEKKDKIYRQKLIKSIFKSQDIKKISPREVNKFINEFVEFLPLFNFNYPQSILDIFNALKDLEEFDNIYKEDLNLLQSYKIFFKIEEENPNEFLAVQPIKMDQEKIFNITNGEMDILNEENLMRKIKYSNVPFVKSIVALMMKEIKLDVTNPDELVSFDFDIDIDINV